MDIFIPPSLNNADAAFHLADSLAKLLDPKEMEKIADDVKAHHALNASEAKKYADAVALIKQHQAILDETKALAAQVKVEEAALGKDKTAFKQECEAERLKIAQERADAKTASETAKNLNSKAEDMISSVTARENALKQEKSDHLIEVEKMKEKAKKAEEVLAKAEEIKRQHTELLESIKAKQAAIAAFNI